MSLAEVVYRVAAGVGSWLILFAHALTLAALPAAECTPGDETLWRGTLVFAVIAALAVILCSAGLRWRRSLRWVAAATAPLLAYDAWWLTHTLLETTLGEASLCAGGAGAGPGQVERIWAPLQLAVVVAAAVQGARYWRPSGTERAHAAR